MRLVLPLVAAAGLAILACGGKTPTGPSNPTVASIAVTPGADTLTALGQTRQLTAVARDAAGNVVSGKTFSWQSSAPTIVSVNPATGLATAIGNGQATLTASVDGRSGQAALLVDQQVTTTEISPGTSGATALGAIQQFTATAKDATGQVIAGIKFLWVSSDPSVATVDSTGKVTARGPGVATITAAARGVPAHAVYTVTQTTTQLAFTAQPLGGIEGDLFTTAVQVEIRDANGALVKGARDLVTLAVVDPAGTAHLGGTHIANAVGGIATFTDVRVDKAGQGLTLTANATGLAQGTSAPFNVMLHFVALSAGNNDTCGVTAAGDLYCWGFNGAGNLGDGTFTDRSIPTRVAFPPGVRLIQTTAGNAAPSCAIASNGATYCWGGGSLGIPAPSSSTTPVLVAAPLGVTFTSLSAGGLSVCGITPGGALYCWGVNANHRLGDGTTTSRSTPTLAATPGGVFFTTVSTAGATGCATTALGPAYCWGGNTSGQIGNGTVVEANVPSPVTMPGGVSFSSVVSGSSSVCGLSFVGTVYCWGNNTLGQLGDGTTAVHSTPSPIAAPAGLTFVQITYASSFGCGVTTVGSSYCWGFNGGGGLGDGTTTFRMTPVAVVMPAGVTFSAISSGNGHTCALTPVGAIYCWGFNTNGQLGDGTVADKLTPVRVAR